VTGTVHLSGLAVTRQCLCCGFAPSVAPVARRFCRTCLNVARLSVSYAVECSHTVAGVLLGVSSLPCTVSWDNFR
jgi:hypothetical protein